MKIRGLLASFIAFTLLGLPAVHAFPGHSAHGQSHCSGPRCVVLNATVSRMRILTVTVRGYRYADVTWRAECSRANKLNVVYISVTLASLRPVYDVALDSHRRIILGRRRLVLHGSPELDAVVFALGYPSLTKMIPCRLHFRVTGIRA